MTSIQTAVSKGKDGKIIVTTDQKLTEKEENAVRKAIQKCTKIPIIIQFEISDSK